MRISKAKDFFGNDYVTQEHFNFTDVQGFDKLFDQNTQKIDCSLIPENDYTAFQVYAHDTRINAGDLATQSHINYIGKQGDVISFAVNASMTETFKLRSEQSQTQQDVVVDWGDGEITNVKDVVPDVLTGEYRYTLSHTYTETGKYIVKIFGKTYFSFMTSGSETTSLICRVFDYDLPIASHIWNLSSAFQHSNRLLHVNMYSHAASYQITHWGSAFTSARNLIECVGFTKYSHREFNYNMFQNCIGLITTDLRIADAPADSSQGNAYTFTNCPKLTNSVDSLLPVQGFKSGTTINIARLFKGCTGLTGTVPSNKLWNDYSVTWLNTSQAFLNCSAQIRSQVPTSWGGTNAKIDTKIRFDKFLSDNKVNPYDYTAFEVYAKGIAISAGSTDSNLGGNGTVLEEIVASREHRMRIRTGSLDMQHSDVIIDWGDGYITTVREWYGEVVNQGIVINNTELIGKIISNDDKETDYVFGHTYNADGKYIIKIYGRDYYSICTPSNSENRESEFNLICRVFDKDLPIASNVTNISSFCAYAKHLLSVHAPSYFDFSRCTNIGGIFRGCRNLQIVKGMKNQFLNVNACAQIFADCYSLTELQFTMPALVTRGLTSSIFQNCIRLTSTVQSLLPAGGFVGTIDANNLFNDCRVLTGTVPAEILWENTSVIWKNTSTAFANCPAQIRAQVPVSWGGTNTSIVVPSSNAQIADKVNALYAHLNLN